LTYESLLLEADQLGVYTVEMDMKGALKGLYADNVICINQNIKSSTEKATILAEEIGHHLTSVGDILDQRKVDNRKQERRARAWAYIKLVPLSKIVQAYENGARTRYDLAEYLNVTDSFLCEAIKYHQEKHGIQTTYRNYIIRLNPLKIKRIKT